MALEYKDRAADTSTTTGTGTITLLGVAPAGFRTFASAHTDGATVRYSIALNDDSEWEVGQGVWTSSGATLTRVTVYASSNAGALVNFSAGTKKVSSVWTAADASNTVDKISVRNATGGTAASGAQQKIPFDTVEYDTGSLWDAANTRIEPTKAGYYLVSLQARFTSAPTNAAAVVRKNGTVEYAVGTTVDTNLSIGGSCMVYCDGASDYIEGWAYTSSAVGYSTTTGYQYLQAHGPL